MIYVYFDQTSGPKNGADEFQILSKMRADEAKREEVAGHCHVPRVECGPQLLRRDYRCYHSILSM